jgi:hypothetical protein
MFMSSFDINGYSENYANPFAENRQPPPQYEHPAAGEAPEQRLAPEESSITKFFEKNKEFFREKDFFKNPFKSKRIQIISAEVEEATDGQFKVSVEFGKMRRGEIIDSRRATFTTRPTDEEWENASGNLDAFKNNFVHAMKVALLTDSDDEFRGLNLFKRDKGDKQPSLKGFRKLSFKKQLRILLGDDANPSSEPSRGSKIFSRVRSMSQRISSRAEGRGPFSSHSQRQSSLEQEVVAERNSWLDWLKPILENSPEEKEVIERSMQGFYQSFTGDISFSWTAHSVSLANSNICFALDAMLKKAGVPPLQRDGKSHEQSVVQLVQDIKDDFGERLGLLSKEQGVELKSAYETFLRIEQFARSGESTDPGEELILIEDLMSRFTLTSALLELSRLSEKKKNFRFEESSAQIAKWDQEDLKRGRVGDVKNWTKEWIDRKNLLQTEGINSSETDIEIDRLGQLINKGQKKVKAIEDKTQDLESKEAAITKQIEEIDQQIEALESKIGAIDKTQIALTMFDENPEMKKNLDRLRAIVDSRGPMEERQKQLAEYCHDQFSHPFPVMNVFLARAIAGNPAVSRMILKKRLLEAE